jgi:hypothetical protein
MKLNRATPFIAHFAAWVFFFSLVLGFLYGSPGREQPSAVIFSWSFLIFGLVYLALFYINTYLLIPYLYLEKKYFAYTGIILLLFAAVVLIKPFDGLMTHFRQTGIEFPAPPVPEQGRPGPPLGDRGRGPGHTDIVSIILFVAVWSLGTAMCIIRQWKNSEKRAIQAEADKANAELSFLKAQINPHFLFNTLNNIYSLAITRNENTADSIMKLSNIMRYVTDDVREDFVSLDNEVECIRDYIDLQKLRLGKKMNVDFSVVGRTEGKKIAPLILMTFVENVFKYGISSHEESAIEIRIAAEEHNIRFYSRNRLFEKTIMHERKGIGIANTRQRLQHLYPNKHFLDIQAENGFYTVHLGLQA